MKLIWNGHSCFTLHADNTTVVLDPYENGYVPGYATLDLHADAVYCSHGHNDHGAKEVIPLTGAPCSVAVETLPSWHDEVQGAKRGANLIHIFSAEGMKVVHLGDLGCELNEEQIASLRGCDVLLIPVGGFYTIDAETAKTVCTQLKPREIGRAHV